MWIGLVFFVGVEIFLRVARVVDFLRGFLSIFLWALLLFLSAENTMRFEIEK